MSTRSTPEVKERMKKAIYAGINALNEQLGEVYVAS
jgi:hypothetical protein